MAFHNINPVREQLKAEILSALSATQESLTTGDLYHACPSATKPDEVAKVAYDMKKKGLIADGGKVPHPRGSPVNSYRYPGPDEPRIEAAKPIKAEAKIKPTRQPAIKRKPAPGHPFAASIRHQEAHDGLPRMTRPLPIHLTTSAPQMAAESIRNYLEEEIMSEDTTEYIPDPDAFSLEPSDPEELDSDLVDALFALSQMDDVGEITEAMAKKNCHCAKIPAPPKLPNNFSYTGFKAEIRSELDNSYLAFESDDGKIILSTGGDITFDLDEINMIPEVAAFLNSLHISE